MIARQSNTYERDTSKFAIAFELAYHRAIVKGHFWSSLISGLTGWQGKYKTKQDITTQNITEILNNSGTQDNTVEYRLDANAYNWLEQLAVIPRTIKNLIKSVTELAWYRLYVELHPSSSSRIPWVIAKIGQTFTSPLTAIYQTASYVFQPIYAKTKDYLDRKFDNSYPLTSKIIAAIAGSIPATLAALPQTFAALVAITAFFMLTTPLLFAGLHAAGLGSVVVAGINFAHSLGSLPFFAPLGSALVAAITKIGTILGLKLTGLLPAAALSFTVFAITPPVILIRALLRNLSFSRKSDKRDNLEVTQKNASAIPVSPSQRLMAKPGQGYDASLHNANLKNTQDGVEAGIAPINASVSPGTAAALARSRGPSADQSSRDATSSAATATTNAPALSASTEPGKSAGQSAGQINATQGSTGSIMSFIKSGFGLAPLFFNTDQSGKLANPSTGQISHPVAPPLAAATATAADVSAGHVQQTQNPAQGGLNTIPPLASAANTGDASLPITHEPGKSASSSNSGQTSHPAAPDLEVTTGTAASSAAAHGATQPSSSAKQASSEDDEEIPFLSCEVALSDVDKSLLENSSIGKSIFPLTQGDIKFVLKKRSITARIVQSDRGNFDPDIILNKDGRTFGLRFKLKSIGKGEAANPALFVGTGTMMPIPNTTGEPGIKFKLQKSPPNLILSLNDGQQEIPLKVNQIMDKAKIEKLLSKNNIEEPQLSLLNLAKELHEDPRYTAHLGSASSSSSTVDSADAGKKEKYERAHEVKDNSIGSAPKDDKITIVNPSPSGQNPGQKFTHPMLFQKAPDSADPKAQQPTPPAAPSSFQP